MVFSLKNSSPPLIRIQNCHQKQDLGCKNPNFVKRVIWRIFDLLFWKNTCFSLFFFNFGVNLLKYAPTHTNDCSSLKKINKKRKQNIPKLSSTQSTVEGWVNVPPKIMIISVTALRLSSYPKGRVELKGQDGRWGTLCGHHW